MANITVDTSDPYAVALNFITPLVFAPNTSCSVDITLNVRERGNATTPNTVAQQYGTDGTCQCDPELTAGGNASSQLFLTCPPCSTNFCAPEHCDAATVQCVADTPPDCSNSDNDLCTPGSCDPEANGGTGACVNGPPTVCGNTDNDLCTAESCNPAQGICETGLPTVCGNTDNDLCTAESCNPATGACETGSRTVCGNEDNFCNPGHCAAETGTCVLDPEPDCSNPDNDLCTPGFCDPTANGGIGACANGPPPFAATPTTISVRRSRAIRRQGLVRRGPGPCAGTKAASAIPVTARRKPGIACWTPEPDCSNPDNDLCTPGLCDPTANGGTGACANGPPTVCGNTDNDLCTPESCNPATGACEPGTRTVCGNEGSFCNPGHCAAESGNCVLDPEPDCANPDNDLCTPGFCDEEQEFLREWAHRRSATITTSAQTMNASRPRATANTSEKPPDFCDDGDPCTDNVCDPQDGCLNPPTEPPPAECGEAICRTPGFWGTHAGTEKSNGQGSVNITEAVLDCADGNCDDHTANDFVLICGERIDSPDTNPADGTTDADDAASSTEAMCVDVKGDSRMQLARQLTAAALNCLISGGGGDCAGTGIYTETFGDCNATCANAGSSNSDITACIAALDCLNNGGSFENGACSPGGPDNCHERILVNEDLGLDFDPPGSAGSSNACQAAKRTRCGVVGPREAECDTDSLP